MHQMPIYIEQGCTVLQLHDPVLFPELVIQGHIHKCI